jgi:hypothetical protein
MSQLLQSRFQKPNAADCMPMLRTWPEEYTLFAQQKVLKTNDNSMRVLVSSHTWELSLQRRNKRPNPYE